MNSSVDLRKLLLQCYRIQPILYAEDELQVVWWQRQREIVQALIHHKRVFVKAGHSVGKSHLAGGLVNWFFDAYPQGLTITTAPTQESVQDIIWKEVRLQRPPSRRGVLQPRAPRMQDAEDHFAVGYTASGDAAFQGRHERAVFLIYDECTGIELPYWIAGEGMMSSEVAYWLALCNPTDTSSEAYNQCVNSGKWHVIDISCLDHPNIAAEIAGEPVPFPSAVRLDWVQGRIDEWCDPVTPGDEIATDFEFPKGSGAWYRPGPLAECRLLGRWPTQGVISVWSEALWAAALHPKELGNEPTVIGCDVARFGDDFTSIVVRRGPCVLHHETHNGWSTSQTAGRLKELCRQWASPTATRLQLQEQYEQYTSARKRGKIYIPESGGEIPEQIAVFIDDDGVGGGVVDQSGGFNFIPTSSASEARDPLGYPNRRSEAWFVTAALARQNALDLSRLAPHSLRLMRTQAMAPVWKVDSQGRRVVEPKADTKKRLKRSPDDMDALNLAFSVSTLGEVSITHAGRSW